MRPGDPLDVAFVATSPNVAALAATVFGKTFDAAGAIDTTLRVRGSLRNLALEDRFVLTNARYGSLEVPRATGTLRADQRSVSLDAGELDLKKGRVLARATVPIRAAPLAIDPNDRPVSAELVADDVEASNVAAMLPKGTTATGRIDGRVDLAGSVRAPRLSGALALAKGYFSGPQERVPITGATGTLRFSGTTAQLDNVRAGAGGGSLSADGTASISNVRDLGHLAMALNLHARNARLDLPQYIKGRFNGDVALTRAPGTQPVMSGTIALDSARVPMTALYNPKATAPSVKPPPLGMNLDVALGRDVRVVSPNVDVGVAGSVRAGGSLAAPQLAGAFTSTGGTVNFFRDFRVQNATVSFDPASGIIPDVDATATTFIDNPQTNVALRVTGPATGLNIAFASDPEYDREQILGLLVNAQSLGAVRGVASTGGGSFSAHSAVSNLATGQIDELFTRNLLEPMSVALGGSLGLENLQLTTDIQGGLGLNAVKALGKDVSFIFADTFNQARRQSWSLDVHPSDRTQLELTAYSSQDSNLLGFTPLLVQGLAMGNAATIPLDTGTNGVDFKLARKFP
jgi:translocation and assembly module TamB